MCSAVFVRKSGNASVVVCAMCSFAFSFLCQNALTVCAVACAYKRWQEGVPKTLFCYFSTKSGHQVILVGHPCQRTRRKNESKRRECLFQIRRCCIHMLFQDKHVHWLETCPLGTGVRIYGVFESSESTPFCDPEVLCRHHHLGGLRTSTDCGFALHDFMGGVVGSPQ